LKAAWIKSKQPEKKEETISVSMQKKEQAIKPPSSVEFIKVLVSGKSNIKINWQPPAAETNVNALIFRSKEILDSKEKLKNAKLITNIPVILGEFIDTIQESGDYYYAILTFKNNLTNFNLTEDANLNSIPVTIKLPSLPEIVQNLNASISDDKKSVIINWQPATNVNKYRIYRSTNSITNYNSLNLSEFLGIVNKDFTSFTDKTILPGKKYYYAVLTENEVGKNTNIIYSKNSTILPLEIPVEKKKEEIAPTIKPEIKEEKKEEKKLETKPVTIKKEKIISKKPKIDYNEKLEFIIINYYYKQNYNKCINELEKIVKKEIDTNIKNKANLFLAKSYFWIGNYKKALNLFVKLKDVYPDETSFWISRITSKLNNKE
jgi:tetratricopeptide (TPR) repeat protein